MCDHELVGQFCANLELMCFVLKLPQSPVPKYQTPGLLKLYLEVLTGIVLFFGQNHCGNQHHFSKYENMEQGGRDPVHEVNDQATETIQCKDISKSKLALHISLSSLARVSLSSVG